MIQQEFIDSLEELHTRFDALAASLSSEEKIDQIAGHSSTLTSLRLMENFIQNEGIFSPNEEFDELDPSLIKFFRLPHFLALVNSKVAGPGRVAALKEAERYYIIFLELLDHYRILPKSITSVLKEASKDGTGFKVQREMKIQLYKEEKAESEAFELAHANDKIREVARLSLIKTAYEDLNALLFIPQELEILKFKHTLETDAKARLQYEQQRAQPPGKLSYFKIDSRQPKDAQIIHSDSIQGLSNPAPTNPTTVVEDYKNSSTSRLLNQRQEVVERLNQHSYAQPKMTLDEFDALEYRLLKEKEQANTDAARHRKEELAKLGIEDSEDSENEIVADAKRLKERNWDDWKDENEKGAGNRGNR